jgi:hypothetical protein
MRRPIQLILYGNEAEAVSDRGTCQPRRFETVKHTSEPDRATELDYDDDDGDTNSGFVGHHM